MKNLAKRVSNFLRLYRETRNPSYVSQAVLTEYINSIRPKRGRKPQSFTDDELALFAKIAANIAAGAVDYEATRVALGLPGSIDGEYPPEVRPVVDRFRDWRAWEEKCRPHMEPNSGKNG